MTRDDEQWIAIQRIVVSMVKESRLADAIGELDSFISCSVNYKYQGDALGYRADLKEDIGDSEGAIVDLKEAIGLSDPSYLRYVHQLRLGSIQKKLGMLEDAIVSYRSALRTCLNSAQTSGGSALRAFLQLVPEATLLPSDRILCWEVVDHSIAVLHLSRPEEHSDFASTIAIIRGAETANR